MIRNPMLPTFPATPIYPEPIFTIHDEAAGQETTMNPNLILELAHAPTFLNVGSSALKETLQAGAPALPAIARLPHAMRCPTWPHRLMRKAALVAVMIVAGWSADVALADQKDSKAPANQKVPAIAARAKPQAAPPVVSARTIPAAPAAKPVIQTSRSPAPQPQSINRAEQNHAASRNGDNDRDNRAQPVIIARPQQPVIVRPVETRREHTSVVIAGGITIGHPGHHGHHGHHGHIDRHPVIHHPQPRPGHVVVIGHGHSHHVHPPVVIAPVRVDGWTLLRDGHDLAAMNAFSDLMRHHPTDATVRVGYAVAAALAGQDAAANSALRAAMACDPNVLARIRLETCLTQRLAHTVNRMADELHRGYGSPNDRFVIAALQYLRSDYRSAYRVANNAIYYGDHQASTHQVRDLALQALTDRH